MPCPGARPNRRERTLASGRERPGIPWAGQPCRCLAAPAGAAATDSPGWRRRDREPSASESHRVLPGCRLAPRFPASPAPNAARRRRWQSAALMTALRHVAVAARSTTHECTTAFEAPSAVAMASVMMATMVAVMMMSVTVAASMAPRGGMMMVMSVMSTAAPEARSGNIWVGGRTVGRIGGCRPMIPMVGPVGGERGACREPGQQTQCDGGGDPAHDGILFIILQVPYARPLCRARGGPAASLRLVGAPGLISASSRSAPPGRAQGVSGPWR